MVNKGKIMFECSLPLKLQLLLAMTTVVTELRKSHRSVLQLFSTNISLLTLWLDVWIQGTASA